MHFKHRSIGILGFLAAHSLAFMNAEGSPGGAASPAPAAPSTPAPAAEPAPGTPAPATTPAPPAEGGEPPAPAPATPAPAAAGAKPSVFARAGNFLKSQSDLVAQITGLQGQVNAANITIAARDQTIADLTAELTDLRAGSAQLEVTLQGLEKKQTTVAAGVADTLAGLGVPAANLPGSESEAKGAQTPSSMYAHYQSLKGGARTAYFRANRATLVEYQNTHKEEQA